MRDKRTPKDVSVEAIRKAVEMCLRVLKESNKSRFDRYSRQKQCIKLNISPITFRDCRVHIFQTTFLEIAVHVLCLRLTQDPGNHMLFSGTYLPRMNKGVFVPTNRLGQRG